MLNPRFLQFNTVPYPLWRRTLPPLVKPLLTQIYRRIYPVDLDRQPPQDPAQIVAYLRRWHLLDDVTLNDVLACAPDVQTATDLPSADHPAPRLPVRIPAQWEPMAAALVQFPVIYPRLWQLHAEMIEAITPVADVQTLVPAPLWARAIALYLARRGKADLNRVRFLHLPVDDIWIRDYGPIIAHDADGAPVVVKAGYSTHWQYPQAGDDAMPRRYAHAQRLPLHDLGLYTEGGNLLTDGMGTLIMTPQIFASNPDLTRPQLEHILRAVFGCEKLIMPPRLNHETTGHVDLLVKLASPDTVFISEPSTPTTRAIHQQAHDLFARETNARGEHYNIVPLPTLPLYYNWFFYGIRRTYTNALTINGRVLVPVYGVPQDEIALRAYADTLPDYQIMPVNCRVGVNGGGAVHCMTKEVPRSRP